MRAVRRSESSGHNASDEGTPPDLWTAPIFEGDFTAPERALLARQFSRCRFELIARSIIDDRIAVIRWQPLPGRRGGGPAPLVAPPTVATYVIDLSETPAGASWVAGAGGVIDRPVGAAASVLPVESTAALEARYPGHFPGVQVKTPGWLRLRRLWFRAIPLLIILLAAIWITLVLWQARGS
jgi:hypothetical protein